LPEGVATMLVPALITTRFTEDRSSCRVVI